MMTIVTPPLTTDGRQRITDEAARLFLERGYAQTSLRDIAAGVGIKAGSIYYHFESKEDLFLAILERGLDVMVAAFEEAANGNSVGGGERIRAHVRAHLAALFEHGPYTATHVTAFHNAPESVRMAIVPNRDTYEAMWTKLLIGLQENAELDPSVDVGLSRLALFGSMNAAVEWFDTDRGNLDELADIIAAQYWRGVATEGARR